MTSAAATARLGFGGYSPYGQRTVCRSLVVETSRTLPRAMSVTALRSPLATLALDKPTTQAMVCLGWHSTIALARMRSSNRGQKLLLLLLGAVLLWLLWFQPFTRHIRIAERARLELVAAISTFPELSGVRLSTDTGGIVHVDGKLRGEEAASKLVRMITGSRLPCEVHIDVSLDAEDTSQPDQIRALEGTILPDGTERLLIGKPGAEGRPWNSGMHMTAP